MCRRLMQLSREKKSYLKRMLSFYFAPVWQSFFRIFYLIFFAYFAIFHSGKVIIAGKFIIYTIKNSVFLLGLGYLFWGVAFIVTLIVPFSISIYSLLLFYEIWQSAWENKQKILISLFIFFATPLMIIVMDDIIRYVASQEELREFVVLNELKIIGK